jgi:hypothetical protein
VTAQCGIPASAKAIAVNLTVIAAATGSITAYPGGIVRPSTTTISFGAGQVRANNAVLGLASDGSGALVLWNSAAAPTEAILDVNGYFQ